jgi:hypothetical protein
MRLGILAVGGEIGGNGIYFRFNPIQSYFDLINTFVKPLPHPVHPICQHLLAFNYKVELMLDILFDDSDPNIERLNYLFLKVRQS